MPDGEHRLGSLPVTVTAGVALLITGGAIAGGTARLLDVVRSTVADGVLLADAVRPATRTPAGLLGRTDVGRLAPGARADVLVTDPDPDLVPVAVLAAGHRLMED